MADGENGSASASNSVTKYAVFGTGCIGGCVGITLASAGYDVSFIGRKSEKFAPVEQRKWMSLTWPEPGSAPFVLKTDNITSDEETGLTGRNVVFVATKRTANKSAAESIAKFSPRGALVVMLQNGLEPSKDVIGVFSRLGRDDLVVFDSIVNFNVVAVAPGELQWISKRADSCIVLDGSKLPTLAEDNICVALRAAGLDSYAEKEFMEVATGKLVINLINAPNALAGCDTQEMFLNEGYRRVWAESIREARAVFRAMGVKRQRSPRDKGNFLVQRMETILGSPSLVIKLIARMKQTKGGKTSMLQDLENRVPETEIDFIAGKIVALGKDFNVSTPVNEKLVDLVKQAEAKRDGSPKLSPEALVAAVGLPKEEPSTCSIS